MAFRNTIANMMAEAEALNGIFAPDETTYAWYRAKGMTDLPYPPIACGEDAVFEIDEELPLGEIAPDDRQAVLAGQRVHAEEVARERITFDKAMIGSCTNGSYDDLLSGALVLVGRAGAGAHQGDDASSWCFPGRSASSRRSSVPTRGSAASRSPTCSAAPAR